MENLTVFKKFEVIGRTKEEAISNAAPFVLRVDATSAYKKWIESNALDENSLKEWMKAYLKGKKFTSPNDAAYIVLQSPIKDVRKRPYKVNKPTYDAKTHTNERFYVVRTEDGVEVGKEKTSAAAIKFSKDFVTNQKKSVNVTIETRLKENNSLYATVDYTPTAKARDCKLLVFGYQNIDQ